MPVLITFIKKDKRFNTFYLIKTNTDFTSVSFLMLISSNDLKKLIHFIKQITLLLLNCYSFISMGFDETETHFLTKYFTLKILISCCAM